MRLVSGLVLLALVLLVIGGAAVANSGSLSSARGVVPVVRSNPAVSTRTGLLIDPQPAVQVRRASRPLLAVIGASFSAGVGAGSRRDAWPQDLARILRWRLVVSADPGAGYVNRGEGERGPFASLAARLDLRRLDPELIIIQGGHDDIGRPLTLIRERVESLVGRIHRQAPQSWLAVLSVFARGNRPSAAAVATDRTIVGAARRADPAIHVFDPLAGHWHFAQIGDHLHPDAAGDRWIARDLAAALRKRLHVSRARPSPRALTRASLS